MIAFTAISLQAAGRFKRSGESRRAMGQDNHIRLAKIAHGKYDGLQAESGHGLAAGHIIALNIGETVEEGRPRTACHAWQGGALQLTFEPSMQRINTED